MGSGVTSWDYHPNGRSNHPLGGGIHSTLKQVSQHEEQFQPGWAYVEKGGKLRKISITDDVSESIKLQDGNLENMLYSFHGTQLAGGRPEYC